MELADRTPKLGNVRAKYDRALIEGAHDIWEIAQLRALLNTQRQELLRLKETHERMMQRFLTNRRHNQSRR